MPIQRDDYAAYILLNKTPPPYCEYIAHSHPKTTPEANSYEREIWDNGLLLLNIWERGCN